jgi:hypothetical protein
MDTTTTRQLEVSLTTDEVAAYAKTLAIETQNRNDLKSEAKKVAKVYKDNINEKEAEIKILASAVKDEKEKREVSCRWRYDWTRNVKTLTRSDTFEIVEERVIDAAERQEHMKLEEAPHADA